MRGGRGTKVYAAQPHVSLFAPQSHQRQHNKDKPYKCPNCYRAYSDSASLQIHLSAHAIKNAKAYSCSMCGRAYTSVSQRTRAASRGRGGTGGFALTLNPPPSVIVAGDLSDEAHVQTHGRGALCDPPVPSEDRVPQHPHPHLPHLRPSHSTGPTRPVSQSSGGSLPGPCPLEPPHLPKADASVQQPGCPLPSRRPVCGWVGGGTNKNNNKKIRAQHVFFFSLFFGGVGLGWG